MTNSNAEKMGLGIFKAIRGFFLTLSGTLLVPAVKALEDNRHRIEFKLGHMLDKMQEALGQGNSASKQNIVDYKKISAALKSKDASQLTPEELTRFQDKYKLQLSDTGKPEFKEHKLPWLKVFAARFFGWAAAIGTNFVFGRTENNTNKWANYKHYEGMAMPKIRTVLTKIPGFKSVFSNTDLISKLVFNDALLTVSSAVTHKAVQGVLHKTDATEESTTPESRKPGKNILTGGPQSLLARAQPKPAEAVLSM